MIAIPQEVVDVLSDEIYIRRDTGDVDIALNELGVVNEQFRAFVKKYEGPFWSECIGVELLDMCEGRESIKSMTEICRRKFEIPNNFLVLSSLSSGQVVMFDNLKDKVYEVDFEGGEMLLKEDRLAPRWESFYSFLIEYFS